VRDDKNPPHWPNLNSSITTSSICRLVHHYPPRRRFRPFIIIFRLTGDTPKISVFSNRRSRRLDSTWCNLVRFRGGRSLIWQPITMPPAMAAANPARRNCTPVTVVESVPIAVETRGLGQPCSSSAPSATDCYRRIRSCSYTWPFPSRPLASSLLETALLRDARKT